MRTVEERVVLMSDQNNQVTRFKNEVNHIPMRRWSAEEMNFFFAVLTRMRDEDTNLVVMNKYELAELANYTITYNKLYENTMTNLASKVSELKYWKKSDNSLVTMPLFTYFKADWNEDLSDMTVEIEVNKRFKHILNEWNEGNWTQFMLNEFTAIQSTYSKSLFRLLKQWRTKGVREFSIDEFKHLMDVPKSYSSGMITSRIISKSVEDLQPYFKDLKVKILKSNARGTPIIGFRFTWKPEKTGKWVENKFEKPKKEILPSWAQDDTDNEIDSSAVNDRLERLRKLREGRK
jgi:plasmid replication initiation protein